MTDLEIDFADDFADSVHDMGVTLYLTTEVERFPAEPYSYGLSRGTTTEASAHLLHVEIGGLILDRRQALLMMGDEWVARLESQYAQQAARAA